MLVDDVTNFIREKWIEFNNSSYLKFRDYVKTNTWSVLPGKLECVGVYVIFEGGKAIYVGSAGGGKHPLKYRIGDLFGYSPRSKSSSYYHPLTRKLAKKIDVKDPEQALNEVRNFYFERCSFKVVKTDTIDQARMLEYVFIILLDHPKYNTTK